MIVLLRPAETFGWQYGVRPHRNRSESESLAMPVQTGRHRARGGGGQRSSVPTGTTPGWSVPWASLKPPGATSSEAPTAKLRI